MLSAAFAAAVLISSSLSSSTKSCPPSFRCFTSAPEFATVANGAGSGEKLALFCPPEAPCTLSGTQLGTGWGLEATLLMENAVIAGPVLANDASGTLLRIDKGNVTATNVTFSGGRSQTGAGCVSNYGTFKCTDCSFSDCQAEQYGGGIESKQKGTRGYLELTRAIFSSNVCGTKLPPNWALPCGAACYCVSNDTSACVGCTCKVHPIYGTFYCDAYP